MCGIAGVFSFQGDSLPDFSQVQMMSSVLAHRGPDGDGIWTSEDKRMVLAHRRLSIIDLSEDARQPMISADKRFTIVFNGEIYNYRELKRDLLSENIEFVSQSDTEVLLHLFAKYGAACLDLLDGMFAFAIWDAHKNELFCARDRFGEKPFYFMVENGVFIFASEIKAIRAYLGSLPLNYKRLQDYLSTSYKFDDATTAFDTVKALQPATYMHVNNSGVQASKYWEIDLSKKVFLENDSAYFKRFHELFMESINFRLRSDVPVGSSLSGGLDSSTVVGALSGLEKKEMHTFSARFHSGKDEGKWIAAVIQKTGMPNHEVWPDENGFIGELDEMTWHHEYPLGSGSVYAQWCVMKMPPTFGVKVLLDGQGADEYLCGYDELKYYAIWNLFHNGKIGDFLRERKLFKEHYGAHGKLGYTFILDPLFKRTGFKRKVNKNGSTLKEQLKYYTTSNLGELLRYADRNAMAHSIEVRLPFLSHKLVEFVFSIPDELIYRNGKTKFILREAMKQELPAIIYNRTDKVGFAPPQQDWMNSPVFLRKYDEGIEVLKVRNLVPGKDKFRNLATATFIKIFEG